MKKNLTISKLDAAKRQLETVIRVYFSNGDPVSIHTLTAAAYNVLRDLNRRRGGEPLLMKEQFLDWIKEGYHQQIRAKLNEAENFFKHADRDHENTLDFNPDQSELLILEACTVYNRLTGEWPPIFRAFQSWFIAHHPDMFVFPKEKQITIDMGREEITSLGREEYFNMVMPMLLRYAT